MKTEHIKHLGQFKPLHEKAKIAAKAGFALTCDAEEVAEALAELAALRHEKSQGWAASALRKRYEVNVASPSDLDTDDRDERKAPKISVTVYPE